MGIGHRTFSAEDQAEIIAAIERGAELGKSVDTTAREFGITGSVYYRWVRDRARATGGSRISGGLAVSRRSRRDYSPDEKAGLVAEIRRRRDAGQPVRAIAEALAVHENSCYRWMRETASVPFRPVQVVEMASVPGLSLIAPGGYRIEGLDVESAARLLRALA